MYFCRAEPSFPAGGAAGEPGYYSVWADVG